MTRPRALAALAAPLVIALGIAFQAGANSGVRHDFERLDRGSWVAGDSVRVSDGTLRLAAGGVAELRSQRSFGNGSFAARLRAARGRDAGTALYLYGAPDHVTLELTPGRDATALVTVARGDDVTHQARVALGFDPAAGFHTYSFERRSGSVTFRADGRSLGTFRGEIPRGRMHLYASASFGAAPARGATVVDWIETPSR